LGFGFGPGWWNLGGFTPRLDRRIHFDNGVLYWPAGASRFLRLRTLFSPNLMFASLLTLNIGCVIRVGSEIAPYESNQAAAWKALPSSAILEMAAVMLFALSLILTLLSPPAHEARQKGLQTAQAS
jgi:hypothetical protein